MNNLLKRILLAIIAVPLLVVTIFYLPHLSHLALNIIIIALSIIGGIETRNLFYKKNIKLHFIKAGITSAIFPVYTTMVTLGLVQSNLTMGILAASLSILFLREALMREKTLIKMVIERLPAYCFILVFPGFFTSYLIRLNFLDNSSLLIIIFLSMVFANDTFAYITGMTLGAKNRGIFPVSPKKSFAGLIGGLFFAGLAGFIFYSFHPYIFKNNPVFAILSGVIIGITSVIGDLFESALKRSANEKDSGTIMAGRGGVLDTIDSILFSAPVFFYIMTLLN